MWIAVELNHRKNGFWPLPALSIHFSVSPSYFRVDRLHALAGQRTGVLDLLFAERGRTSDRSSRRRRRLPRRASRRAGPPPVEATWRRSSAVFMQPIAGRKIYAVKAGDT